MNESASQCIELSISIWKNKRKKTITEEEFPIYLYIGFNPSNKEFAQKFITSLESLKKEGKAEIDLAEYNEEKSVLDVIGYFNGLTSLKAVIDKTFEKKFTIINYLKSSEEIFTRSKIINRAKEALA